MRITVKDFEEYDYVVFTDKRPSHWNVDGNMDYLLGATIPIEELEIIGEIDNMTFALRVKDEGWWLSLSDIVSLETKNSKIKGEKYIW